MGNKTIMRFKYGKAGKSFDVDKKTLKYCLSIATKSEIKEIRISGKGFGQNNIEEIKEIIKELNKNEPKGQTNTLLGVNCREDFKKGISPFILICFISQYLFSLEKENLETEAKIKKIGILILLFRKLGISIESLLQDLKVKLFNFDNFYFVFTLKQKEKYKNIDFKFFFLEDYLQKNEKKIYDKVKKFFIIYENLENISEDYDEESFYKDIKSYFQKNPNDGDVLSGNEKSKLRLIEDKKEEKREKPQVIFTKQEEENTEEVIKNNNHSNFCNCNKLFENEDNIILSNYNYLLNYIGSNIICDDYKQKFENLRSIVYKRLKEKIESLFEKLRSKINENKKKEYNELEEIDEEERFFKEVVDDKVDDEIGTLKNDIEKLLEENKKLKEDRRKEYIRKVENYATQINTGNFRKDLLKKMLQNILTIEKEDTKNKKGFLRRLASIFGIRNRNAKLEDIKKEIEKN